MTPLKLSVQAFGPFAGKEDIDFTALGDNPLFLINGPTGAGKSSILDAICFALYGQTAGADRQAQQMRCDHAKPDILCEVRLEFMLNKKRYAIWRSPIQERPKSRGEGLITKRADASIWYLDGSADGVLEVSNSVVDANSYINTLMGIGVEQFRQVMILPQDKFRELLMADSKDRENVFSQLFETHIYKQIENKLREQASGIKQAVELHHSKIRGLLEAANLDSLEQLDQEIKSITPLLASAKAEKDDAQALVQKHQRDKDTASAQNQLFDDLHAKHQELSDLQAKSSDIQDKKSQLHKALNAQKIYHLYTNNMQCEASLVSATTRVEQAKRDTENALATRDRAAQKVAQAKTAALELDDLKAQQNELTRISHLLTTLENANAQAKHTQAIADKSAQTLKHQKQALASLAAELEDTQNQIDTQTITLKELLPQQLILEKLAEKQSERKVLNAINVDTERVTEQLSEQQSSVNELSKAFDKAKTHALETEMAWHMGQASALAKALEQDSPCPVCGSKDHPNPAQYDAGDIITKSHVDTARQQEGRASQIMQSAKEVLVSLSNKREALQTKSGEQQQRLGSYGELTLEQFKQQQGDVAKKVSALRALEHATTALTSRIKEIKARQAHITHKLAGLETTAHTDNNAMVAALATQRELQAQVPSQHQDIKALEASMQTMVERITRLTSAVQQSESDFSAKQSVLDQTSTTQKECLRQQQAHEKTQANAAQAWQAALSMSEFNDAESLLLAQKDEHEQRALQDIIVEYQRQLDRTNAIIEGLSQKLKDKQKRDIQSIEQTLSQYILQLEDKDKQWRELAARVNNLNQVKAKLHKAKLENEALNQQYSIIGTLSEVANGNTGNKISLQRFVLSVLLDDVLIQASQRLHIMSKGRYQLVRKEDRAKGNKASGLELEVHDGDTGKPRSVSTLSGGESFMAALSLALGLSDVVQSYAGGIHLDTLFIDEGFGSLDSDSLDAAIRVLIDLQASGRMIGIISHVTELKDQMAKRINVHSSRTGSSISMST